MKALVNYRYHLFFISCVFVSTNFCIDAAVITGKHDVLPLNQSVTAKSDLSQRKAKKKKGRVLKARTQKRVTFSAMTFKELKVAKQGADATVARKYLERMITLCDDVTEKADLIIELADLLFGQQLFDDAVKWYTDFSQQYPGNKKVEYVLYRAIVCSFNNTLSPDRDQTMTEKTLTLIQAFLGRDDLSKAHKKEVLTIKQECQRRLATSDILVADFYLYKQSDYDSARKRLESIRSNWLKPLPEISVMLAQLEVDLSVWCKDFKVSDSSLKLAKAGTADVLSKPKIDMTTRF